MIKAIVCPKCGRSAYPGEIEFASITYCSETDDSVITIHCGCGYSFETSKNRDQAILSTNIFTRLEAASNHTQSGNLQFEPGIATSITFDKPFDYIGNAFLTTRPDGIFVKEIYSSTQE